MEWTLPFIVLNETQAVCRGERVNDYFITQHSEIALCKLTYKIHVILWATSASLARVIFTQNLWIETIYQYVACRLTIKYKYLTC